MVSLDEEPLWYRERFGTAYARLTEMYAARIPRERSEPTRPLAPVTQIGPVLAERRAERVVAAIRRMSKGA